MFIEIPIKMLRLIVLLLSKLITPALVYLNGRSAGAKAKEIEKLNEELDALRAKIKSTNSRPLTDADFANSLRKKRDSKPRKNKRKL